MSQSGPTHAVALSAPRCWTCSACVHYNGLRPAYGNSFTSATLPKQTAELFLQNKRMIFTLTGDLSVPFPQNFWCDEATLNHPIVNATDCLNEQGEAFVIL